VMETILYIVKLEPISEGIPLSKVIAINECFTIPIVFLVYIKAAD
jgi:hypothetical protein